MQRCSCLVWEQPECSLGCALQSQLVSSAWALLLHGSEGERPAYLLHTFSSQTSEIFRENSFALTHPYQNSSSPDFYYYSFPRCYSCSSHLHAVFLLQYVTLRCTSISFYIITYWKNSIFTSVWWVLTDTLLPYANITGNSVHVKLKSVE